MATFPSCIVYFQNETEVKKFLVDNRSNKARDVVHARPRFNTCCGGGSKNSIKSEYEVRSQKQCHQPSYHRPWLTRVEEQRWTLDIPFTKTPTALLLLPLQVCQDALRHEKKASTHTKPQNVQRENKNKLTVDDRQYGVRVSSAEAPLLHQVLVIPQE